MSIRKTTALFALGVVLVLLTPITSIYALAPVPSDRYTITDHISGQISDFAIAVEDDTVGRTELYTVKFTLNGDSLRSRSKIELDFPVGYVLDDIDSVRYTDTDDLASDFGISGFQINGLHLSISLDSLEILPPMGTRVMIEIYSIANPQLAESYQVLLAVLTEESELLALPKLSDPLVIRPGPLASFKLSPKGIQQARAGTTIHFEVDTDDQFGNAVSVMESEISWGVIGVPTPTGIVEGGDFQAQHTGVSRVFATLGAFADTSGLVYVLPGAFAYFTLTGGADTCGRREQLAVGSR